MAEFVPAVSNILSLIERGDWERLDQALAPDVLWINMLEERFEGPAAVIAALKADPVPGAPAFHAVDESGRLTHWVDKSG